MNYTFYEIAMIFFIYSFLAWLTETAIATVKVKNFRNRGFASGPFCFIYGCTGVILTVFFQELKNDTFFLFMGSSAVATAVEWFTGKTLERMKQSILTTRGCSGFILMLYNSKNYREPVTWDESWALRILCGRKDKIEKLQHLLIPML